MLVRFVAPFFFSSWFLLSSPVVSSPLPPFYPAKNASVIIIGAGVTGIIAARTLAQRGVSDFLIVEGREEIGGRLQDIQFGTNSVTLELGANWIHGTQEGEGPANPIWLLAQNCQLDTRNVEYDLSTHTFEFFQYPHIYADVHAATYDYSGLRMARNQEDMSARTGLSLSKWRPHTPQERAVEYLLFDQEYSQTPDESSWFASAWGSNYTYDATQGGFGGGIAMSVDQRGFKTFLSTEAETFLRPDQILYNSVVKQIEYTNLGVEVQLNSGEALFADHVLVTVSLGVLQNDEVTFVPELPSWKEDAIHAMTMGIYTKIFFQFSRKFWFDTAAALYADHERGRYPVWQSLDHIEFLPNSGILMVTVTNDFSERIESMTDEEVREEVLSIMRIMFPEADIPAPLAFFFPRWSQDPLFRGSYSNWPVSFSTERQNALRAPVDRKVWFAGEATSRKYFGYLHGAYFEGQKAGLAIAECVQGGCNTSDHYGEPDQIIM
ncbi:amine oxidase [Sistotremastrum suecicum HHB10207 ss-3]|uniref:Amine oxidase n=1 Tax=Sistotremastrum suecicum HHB10207 ss-3 TaxID=1314776 RepID=A0A166I312_9AGAM|nr:amine oxidase [Sistotremastrum suecicum HHB10207 ss-3]